MEGHERCVLGFTFVQPNLSTRLLGHKDVSTTMIYTHVLSKGGHGVRSSVDGLEAGLYSLYNPEWAIDENAEKA